MSYGVPFIYRSGPLCYFNTDKQGVYVGFFWGRLLQEKSKILEKDDRKLVKLVRIHSLNNLSEIEDELIELFIYAIEIDEQKYGLKKTKSTQPNEK